LTTKHFTLTILTVGRGRR